MIFHSSAVSFAAFRKMLSGIFSFPMSCSRAPCWDFNKHRIFDAHRARRTCRQVGDSRRVTAGALIAEVQRQGQGIQRCRVYMFQTDQCMVERLRLFQHEL